MRLVLLLPTMIFAAAPLVAQDGGQTAGGLLSRLGGGTGGTAGALGGMVPGLGSAGSGNITGLLGYCVKNQLLGAVGGTGAAAAAPTGAKGLLGTLTSKPGLTKTPGYLSGEQGVVQTGGTSLSLDSLGAGVKQKVCGQVMSRAKGLVGR